MKKLMGTWVIGVSGGADSMALLAMCYHLGMDIIVAHVNYQKRESALRDERGVSAYCKERKIPFFVRRVEQYKATNFQAQARTIRYTFFRDLVQQYHGEGVLVAHHLDDVLETYLMQRARRSIPAYYGIKQRVMLHGVVVERMLLGYSKTALISYCKQHQVPYFIDESNASDRYTRNRIRHERVEMMSDEEKVCLLVEIKEENKRLEELRKRVENVYKEHEGQLTTEMFEALDEVLATALLRYWLYEETKQTTLSLKAIHNVYKNIKTSQNWTYQLRNEYVVACDYGRLSVKRKAVGFRYEYRSIQEVETPYFKIKLAGKKIEGVRVDADDFPIVLRNYEHGDKIKLRYGTKKVARFFIDRKITRQERENWPVLVNNMGEIIFVCGIGCDMLHYSNNFNMFVVK